MTKISNYAINTHYTALKQLPDLYSMRLNVPAQSIPPNTLGRVLASTTVNVPAGVYTENIVIRSSLDGNINHIRSEMGEIFEQWLLLTISCTHVESDRYELRAVVNNTGNTTVLLPAFTAEAFLRLAIAPFSV